MRSELKDKDRSPLLESLYRLPLIRPLVLSLLFIFGEGRRWLTSKEELAALDLVLNAADSNTALIALINGALSAASPDPLTSGANRRLYRFLRLLSHRCYQMQTLLSAGAYRTMTSP